jgi:hypothetical protein
VPATDAVGLNYAFQLAFPRVRAADVLRATAAFAEPVGECLVTLPDGERLALPFTVGLESVETALETGMWALFDTVLWLPVDDAEAWRYYRDERSTEGRVRRGKAGDEVAVGYVYLTVGIGARYALFTFSAATSDMSRVFSESEAVRRRFARLLEDNGGLRGLLDLEWGAHFPLITRPGAYVVLDEGVLREAGPDAWVEAAIAAPTQTD